jgi:hypothetical protein
MQKLKQCTFKPALQSSKIFAPQNNENNKGEKHYERLYNHHSKKLNELEKELLRNKEENEYKELKECTFKPQVNNNQPLDYVFNSNRMDEKDISLYEKTIERMRNGILENFKKKYLAERITTGENWLKVKMANIKPFDITDLRPPEENSLQASAKEDDEYFSIHITIPNGKERVLRISKYDDPEEVADNFCKIYGLKDEIKIRLTKTISHFINLYLNKTSDDSQQSNQHLNSDDNKDFEQ